MIHADIIKLYEKQLGLERQLALNPNPITVIQDFIPLAMDDILILNFFKKMVSVFVILGFFFSAIWQSRSKIWQIIRGKK